MRRVWVLGPTHVMADVTVAPNATQAFTEVSVISGMQVATSSNAFQIQASRPGLANIGSVLNGDLTQQTIFPGGAATIFGSNLAGAQVTLNDLPLTVTFSNASQINVLIPTGFATGPATLKVNTAAGAAFPVLLQIDAPPPVITAVNSSANLPLSGSSAASGDTLQVLVSGLDPSAAANFKGRVRVTIAGIDMTVQQITSAAAGAFQIQVVLTQSFAGSQVPLVVWVDGAASVPVNVTIR